MVEAITPINEDFCPVVYPTSALKAELVDYSAVKGCVILRPYWLCHLGKTSCHLDKRFKGDRPRKRGHAAVYP